MGPQGCDLGSQGQATTSLSEDEAGGGPEEDWQLLGSQLSQEREGALPTGSKRAQEGAGQDFTARQAPGLRAWPSFVPPTTHGFGEPLQHNQRTSREWDPSKQHDSGGTETRWQKGGGSGLAGARVRSYVGSSAKP